MTHIPRQENGGWLPIETAPKDGRCVLLLSAAHEYEAAGELIKHSPHCAIGKWNAEGDSWTDETGGFVDEICTLTVTGTWDSGVGWFQPNEVTHWMPLPPPPRQEGVE